MAANDDIETLEPEVSMMDYGWNEDDIKLDFMTGEKERKNEKSAFEVARHRHVTCHSFIHTRRVSLFRL